MKPSVGRIVHFNDNGIHRPAIITHVWSIICVNLNIFNDGTYRMNDSFTPSFIVTSVSMGEVNQTWHWPEVIN